MVKIKKILVVGTFASDPNIYMYANSFLKTFQNLGYIVEKFNCKNNFGYYLTNLLLLRSVAKVRPDMVFFLKSENIFPSVIKRIKGYNCLVVNFYPDNPFAFWNGNSNSNVLKSLPLYDCFLSWSKMLIPALESAGCKNVCYFPFAYDEGLFSQDVKITQSDKKKYDSDVCFVGTWEAQREKILTTVCEKLPNINLAIWGNLWDEKVSKDSVLRQKLRGPAIYKDEMIKAFRLSKIVLNFIRKQNMTSHNMRTFEVVASGSFLLTQRTEEQCSFLFKEGESIACFEGVGELMEKLKFYLHNDEDRIKITQNGTQSVQNFTIHNLLKNFMLDFEKGVCNEV